MVFPIDPILISSDARGGVLDRVSRMVVAGVSDISSGDRESKDQDNP